MAVEASASADQFQPGIPTTLFEAPVISWTGTRNRYVVTADGQRFLIVSPADQGPASPITVVMNWTAISSGFDRDARSISQLDHPHICARGASRVPVRYRISVSHGILIRADVWKRRKSTYCASPETLPADVT